MIGELVAQDAFYLTFGKENWTAAQIKTAYQQSKQPSTNKYPIKNPDLINHQPKISRLLQHKRTKPAYNYSIYKQNIDCNRPTVLRSSLKSTMTDWEIKHSFDLEAARQQRACKSPNYLLQKSARKYPNLFQADPNNRPKLIETATTAILDKTKTISQHRKLSFKNEPQTVYDKYKLIQTQTPRKTKFAPINPTIFKYNQEINKIDSLINRIDACITSSVSKNRNQPKNYSFDKA